MKRERLLLTSKELLNTLRKSPFKLYIRAKNFEPVGVMTKREHKYDSGWGQMRLWAIGLTLDGKKFEEPLDRKNRRTGDLEDLVQMETDLILVTARSTTDPDDDNDDNFQYFINPHQANRLKDAFDRVKERDRIIQDLQKKLDETEHARDFYQREAETSGSEIRNLKAKVSHVSEKLANSEQQSDHYRTLVKKSQILDLEVEGAMDEKMGGARKRGEFQAKDSADVILDAAKRQKEAQRHLTNIGMGNMSPEYATKGDLRDMESKIMDAITTIRSVSEKRTTQPPASTGILPKAPQEYSEKE